MIFINKKNMNVSPKNVPPKNVAPTITTWITMGFALVALILGIVALTVQPKSIQVLEQDMLKLKTLEQDMLKLKTMPTTLEKLDMPVNVFKGTNLSTGSLMVCSDGKYVTIKASFALNVRIIEDDGVPSEIGHVERSLGNNTHYGRILCILNFPDSDTKSLQPCLLRIDDMAVSLVIMSKMEIPKDVRIVGVGVFPIMFEPKTKA